MLGRLLPIALILAVFLPESALAYISPGEPTGFINDFAGALTIDQKNNLEQQLEAYEASTTNEISVAIINSLNGDTIENYSISLAEEWQIGKEAKDNGVLILVVVADRQMRIEVGYGLEPYLTDLEANQIINQIMKPAFQAGDFYGGLSGAVGGIEKILSGEQLDLPLSGDKKPINYGWLVDWLIFGFFVFFELIVSILARSKSWWGGGVVGGVVGLMVYFFVGLTLSIIAATFLIPLGLLIDYWVSKSYHQAKAAGRPWLFFGGRGGSSGSGGFGGFGGGSFGGGGSSGRW